MSRNEITCELVDERDLDTRYLAGRLNPEEAEGFEAHFFGCERCWGLVQQGQAVRIALRSDAPVSQLAAPGSRHGKTGRRWWGLAAAAAVAAVVLGTWWTGEGSDPAPTEDVFRGGDTVFVVAASAARSTLQAAWPRLENADLYRVRLYAADGTLIAQRELVDTSIVLQRDSIPLPPQASAFWEVQALDPLRRPIGRSEPTRAEPPGSTP